jgi:hypothetical protein
MFPISALDEIVPVDLADPGIGQALTTFLEGEEGSFWPQEGWVVLHQTESEALVVTLGDEGPVFVTTTFEDEEWVWSGAQGGRPCPLEFAVPEGINSVDWRLDPARPAPEPDSGTIAVILNERPCVSGQEIGDRLLGPQVVMTDTQVFIAFAAERPPGDTFDCPGNPETPFVVELPEPLGDRELIEGLQVGFDLEDYLN